MESSQTPPPNDPSTEIVPSEPAPKSSQSWCIALHLFGLSGLILPIFLANILIPLIIWLFKREESAQLDEIGKEVLNFQISFTIYLFISGLLCMMVVGCFLIPFVFFAWLILPVCAAIKTSNGIPYSYPFTIRFLK